MSSPIFSEEQELRQRRLGETRRPLPSSTGHRDRTLRGVLALSDRPVETWLGRQTAVRLPTVLSSAAQSLRKATKTENNFENDLDRFGTTNPLWFF